MIGIVPTRPPFEVAGLLVWTRIAPVLSFRWGGIEDGAFDVHLDPNPWRSGRFAVTHRGSGVTVHTGEKTARTAYDAVRAKLKSLTPSEIAQTERWLSDAARVVRPHEGVRL